MKSNGHKFKAALAIILLIYLGSALSSAYALLPNVDEAWFTIPGYNLVENGFFGTSTLEETANFRQVRLDGIKQYTYWIMPIFPLTQGAWGAIAGFGLMQTRFISVFFGIIALVSWAFFIKKMSASSRVALIAAGILAIDYHFVYAASLGRMDMMTIGLGTSALAVYAALRETNFARAILSSYALTALAFFAHPLGLLWFASLTILVALLDFRQIRVRHFALAAAPYFVFGLIWSIYIFQRPDLFSVQFGGNASDRWGFFRTPVSELWREIQLRYLFNFGVGEGLSSAGQIKITVLIAYLSAIIGILAVKDLRTKMLSRFLLLVAVQEFAMLLLLDGMKQHYYMIYVTPTLTVLLAVWLNWLWTRNNSLRLLSCGVLLLVVGIHLSTNLLRVQRDDYHAFYLPAGTFLNQNVQPDDLIMASSEFWFVLDCKESLIDDFRLGYLSGKNPGFIVIDAPRYKDWLANLAEKETAAYAVIARRLQNDYQIIYENEKYRIYKRIIY